MIKQITSDTVVWADGDYETHSVHHSGSSRQAYSLNIKTGSRFDEGWFDWPDRLQRAHLKICSPISGETFESKLLFSHNSNQTRAYELGVPYDEPDDFDEGRAYRRAFQARHGRTYSLEELDFPWAKMTSEDVEYVIGEFLNLLNHIQLWGGGDEIRKQHDLYFKFDISRVDERVKALFVLKVGERNYVRVKLPKESMQARKNQTPKGFSTVFGRVVNGLARLFQTTRHK